MAQPVWQTPAGSLGVVPESVFFRYPLVAVDPDAGPVTYTVIAGALPSGIQCTTTGEILGVPVATTTIQGVPTPVNQDVTSKFVIRANASGRISDRTFSLTVTGNDTPNWLTPAGSIGVYYDGDRVDYQFLYEDIDPGDVVTVKLVNGSLPGGLALSATGLLSGYIQPATPFDQTPGYDRSPAGVEPYDFVTQFQSRNYQFTLEVSDGKNSDVRTFTMFVWARNELTADNTQITADLTTIDASQTNIRAPFLVNDQPSNLGRIRSDNYYAYEFIGDDYDSEQISYAITVNQGFGLPPGLQLDPKTGWFYGTIPDQGTTEIEYSFNVLVYQSTPISTVECTSTSSTNNRITCTSTAAFAGQEDWYISGSQPLYIPIKLSGTALGGLSTAGQTLYWVMYVYDDFTFSVTDSPTGTTPVTLTTSTGSMTAGVVVTSEPYPFSMTIIGDIDSEITWLTDSNLGVLVNGETSLLKVEAVNRGGRELQYKLASGQYNSLPQGLQLLPSGEIAGRATFNTFAIDLGATIIDGGTTTWDSNFSFVVNAYAPDTQQTLYSVAEVQVVNGGTDFSQASPPTIVFSTPIGASAVQAQVGNITIVGGAITAVEVLNAGDGYTGPATLTITEGFGGDDANLVAVMQATGTRDVVSVFKTFNITLSRQYNAPYQNLYVEAMPPEEDRLLIDTLLDNDNIFVPSYIFRPTDPNFGKSRRVTYQHAFGLAPDALETYVSSLYLNHYWKYLTLGEIQTAVARDENDNIVYEVVYSKIIDNLVNDQGESVSKIVTLPYAINDPVVPGDEIRTVYPNSLINMRDQVIDTVGQISTGLPLWMTSKQEDGRVLGFTPAWVIAYVNPGRGKQIAYYLQQQFGEQLNKVDFKVDRYIVDRSLSLNWDTTTQDWTPQPSLTTFDRFDTSGFTFVGNVDIATNLAYSDVNNRTLTYINELGGLDGVITLIDGNTLIFAKQENYDGPPGSAYPNTDDAWLQAQILYDQSGFDQGSYDQGYTVSGGETLDCTETDATTDQITYVNLTDAPKVYPGLPLRFTNTIGGLISDALYVCLTAPSDTAFTVAKASFVTNTQNSTDLITVDDIRTFSVGDPVVFYQTVFGGLVQGTTYYIRTIQSIGGDQAVITVSLTPGGVRETLSTATGTCIMRGTTVSLTTDSGAMEANTFNERMAIYRISVDPVTELVTLTITDQTASNEYVQISRGTRYRSAQLYRPNAPGQDLTRVSWLPLLTVTAEETTFDKGSVEWIEPVDMYNPGQTNDKYLVFPKSNILV